MNQNRTYICLFAKLDVGWRSRFENFRIPVVGLFLSLTFDGQLKLVSWRTRGKRNVETLSYEERGKNVAHYVDVGVFVTLELPPDYWIVEHVEVFGVERAFQYNGLTSVLDQDLALG